MKFDTPKIIITILFLIIVAAFGMATIPNPGHTASMVGGENDADRTFNGLIDENYTFPTNLKVYGNLNVNNNITADYFFGDGSKLKNVRTIFVGLTPTTTNGRIISGTLTGYPAANAICNATYLGSHMCETSELIKTIAYENFSSLFPNGLTSWISNGPPGFTAQANDCNGWTTSSGSALGPFWAYDTVTGGMGWLVACDNAKLIGCCR